MKSSSITQLDLLCLVELCVILNLEEEEANSLFAAYFDQIDRVIAFTMERFGRLYVLVNNAGGSPEVPAATVTVCC